MKATMRHKKQGNQVEVYQLIDIAPGLSIQKVAKARERGPIVGITDEMSKRPLSSGR